AGTVALVDNGDGTYDFTDAAGNTTIITDTSISTLVDNLDGTYTYTDETGLGQILDFNAAALPFDNTVLGNLAATDVQAAIDEVSTAVAGGSDDQVISTDGNPGNISIETGNTIVLNVEDGDFDATNELNSNITMVAGALEITDAAGPISENLISTDVNNNLIFGTDGRLYLNVDAAASGETITSIIDNNDGTFTYTNENSVPVTISKSDITDLGDGTYTFTNNDGSDVTIDTRAASNPYDNTITGLLTASDVQGALDELAGGADSQDISTDNSPGNISIQNGSTLTLNVDDADASATNELQDLSLAVNTLSLSGDATPVDLSGYLDNTDAQDLSLTGNTLALTGDATPVDLSGYLDNTDAQTVSTDGTAGNISISGGNTIALNVNDADASARNEIQDLSLAVNTLSLSGDATPVDLSGYLDNTDAQTVSTDGTAGNISISGGNTIALNVNDADADPNNEIELPAGGAAGQVLSTNGLGVYSWTNDNPGTDDQTAAEVTYNNATSGLTATDVQGAIDEVAASGPTSVFHSLGFINGALVDGALGGVINSQNIASVSRSSAGRYTINFTTPANSVSYIVQLTLRGLPEGTILVSGAGFNSFSVWINDEFGAGVDAQFYLSIIDF
ncbi:MAG: hypothetical protein KJO69_06000, partial [Gammaproteobacteria bacterium]|nr:hypothetical protein [Gammaproteobacteria bacterium]